MGFLQAKLLLIKAAQMSRNERETFSKQEIVQKINEIKYLSAQKKVPKLTLRKEIIHLENKLKEVLELEKKLYRYTSSESAKVTGLKRQIKTLKENAAYSKDEDMSKKVNKLSHLLGESLAKKEIKEDVALSQKVVKELKGEDQKAAKEKKLNPEMIEKAHALQDRLNALRQEIKIYQELETKSPEEMKVMETQAKLIQQKLRQFYEKHPELLTQDLGPIEIKPTEVKHKILFSPEDYFEEMSKKKKSPPEELPLPPPPRISSR